MQAKQELETYQAQLQAAQSQDQLQEAELEIVNSLLILRTEIEKVIQEVEDKGIPEVGEAVILNSS